MIFKDNSIFTFNFLLGPCIWCITKFKHDNYEFSLISKLIHFVPFIFFYLLFVPEIINFQNSGTLEFPKNICLIKSNIYFIAVGFWYLKALKLLIFLLNIIYYVISSNFLLKYYVKTKDEKFKIDSIFIAFFIFLTSFFILLDCVHCGFLSLTINTIKISIVFQKFILISVFLFLILFKEQIIERWPFKMKTEKLENTSSITEKMEILPSITVTNPNKKIISFWDNETSIFLREDFNIDIMAKHLNLEKNKLRIILYQLYKMHFKDILNRHRIHHVLSKMKSDNDKIFKIETILKECGYSNRSTFYTAFKKVTKTTPTDYMKGFLN